MHGLFEIHGFQGSIESGKMEFSINMRELDNKERERYNEGHMKAKG